MSLNRRDLLRTALLASGSAALPWSLAGAQPTPSPLPPPSAPSSTPPSAQSASSQSTPAQGQSINDQLKGYLQGLHDPVITKADGLYHVFGSGGWTGKPGISWRVSPDLFNWTDNGSPIAAVPDWALRAIPGANSIWAPDISFYNGLYQLYYAVSTGGSMRSVIGFATNPTLDKSSPHYRWTDHGLVTESFVGGTYNAIDPNFVVDRQGGCWLAFGSYWSGLKLLPLDPHTGKPRPGDKTLHSIAYRPAPEGGDNPIEGAFIFTHGKAYYLFASYDYCCKGLKSNYYVAVGRSEHIIGPYVGRDGKPLMEGYGTAVLIEKPWASTRWRGPGHCGLMHDGVRDLMVYHAYDAQNNAQPTLRISAVTWDADGWPHVSA